MRWAGQIDELAHRRVDASAVITRPTTARVESAFWQRFRRDGFCEDVAIGHSVLDSKNTRWFAMYRSRAHACFRRSRTVPGRCLGLSALIIGCSMAYSRQYIQQYR